MSSQSFADLGVSDAVVDALAARGITAPFPIQRLVVPDVLAGRDVLVKSPTGSGKTLAFGVPMVDRIEADRPPPDRARARADARARAADRRGAARARPRPRARRSPPSTAAPASSQAGARRRKAHILVATPGRLEDLLAARRRHASRTSGSSSSTRPTACSTWASGPRSTASSPSCPRDRQTLFFSATLDGEAGRVAARYTNDARRHEHGRTRPSSAARSSTASSRVDHEGKLDALVRELRDARPRPHARLRPHQARRRPARQAPAGPRRGRRRHARRQDPGPAREGARAASAPASVDTLVATDVAARGIDVDDITHVINFDAPERPRGLRPPRRPHRPRRAHRRRHHVRRRRPGARRAARSPASSTCTASSPRRGSAAAADRRGSSGQPVSSGSSGSAGPH